MLAHVSFREAATVVISGASFLPLALLLGFVLARFGLTVRDSAGVVRKSACAWVAVSLALLVFAHAMVLWSLDLYHPAVSVFYLCAGVLVGTAMWAKPTGSSAPRR